MKSNHTSKEEVLDTGSDSDTASDSAPNEAFNAFSEDEDSADAFSEEESDDELEDETLFDIICKLAVNKDEKGFSELINKGACINLLQGEYSPIMLLAKKGDLESVRFLVNKCGGNLNHAVEGAARGNQPFVKQLLDHGASLNFAVRGAARENNVQLMDELLERGASLDFAAEGAAAGNHIELTNDLINKRKANKDYAALGAARGNHVTLTNDLIERGASLNFAVEGAAAGNHPELAHDLISRGASMHKAFTAATAGNHTEFAKQLAELIEKKNINEEDTYTCCLLGAASAGNTKLIKYLLNMKQRNWKTYQKTLNLAVGAAAKAGHMELTSYLIRQGANPDCAVEFAVAGENVIHTNLLIGRGASHKQAVKGLKSQDYAQAQHFISFIKDPEFKKLLTKQSKLNYLMTEYKLTLSEAEQYLAVKGNNWLFQGKNLIGDIVDEKIPYEVYLHVTSFVVGCSVQSAETIVNVANERVKARVKSDFGFFKSKEQEEEDQEPANITDNNNRSPDNNSQKQAP